MGNNDERAGQRKIVLPVPDAVGVLRFIGTAAGAVFAYLAALVGPNLYETWKAAPSLDSLNTALAGVGPERWVLVVSVVVFLFAGVMERRLRHTADRSLLDDRLLLTQLGKITLRLADGVRLPRGQRIDEERQILKDVLNALYVACTEVEDTRVIFYRLNPDSTELHVIDFVGGRSPLGPFKAGTDRGDDALKFVTSMPAGHAELIQDTKKEKRIGWSGSGNGYRTYISTVVGNASVPIGMLSIDAKKPRSLSHADKRYASMAAGLLAIAFTKLR